MLVLSSEGRSRVRVRRVRPRRRSHPCVLCGAVPISATDDQHELLSPTSHRLDGLPFVSEVPGRSHVHYLKVVTKLLKHSDTSALDLLTYKYTVHSNMYDTREAGGKDAEPVIDFKYDLSPISIVVQQERMPLYRFVTSSCAIIGGVFTVIGLLENLIHVTGQQFSKKQI